MATYIIYNDYSTVPHKLSGGQTIGLEIHQMAYAFGCTSSAALNNTIFVEYKIINKTANTYPDFYFGMWSDIDIGNAGNEFVECDVTRSCYFQYNNNGTDANSGSTLGYGNYHPTQGVVILSGPWIDGDWIDNSKTWDGVNAWCPNGIGFEDVIIDNERWGLTGFMHNNVNGYAYQAMPTTASQYHGVMKSYWPDNTYLRYGAEGHVSDYFYDVPSKFAFPGASDPLGYGTSGMAWPAWSPSYYGDEKSIGNMGPITFQPGQINVVEVAYVFAQNTITTGVQPGKDLFFQYVDEIKNLYTTGNLFCNSTTNVVKVDDKNDVVLFPNPASDKLYINGLENDYIVNIRILAVDGKLIKELTSNTRTIDLNEMETGIYFIEITTENNKLIRKIIKD
ncbi:MAG: T9SS type A sorting domain-containing protein [Bacteroidetes bacterium]|nr:T9SS type A sorting domain-containing protein [Bacteroidota bacterium]